MAGGAIASSATVAVRDLGEVSETLLVCGGAYSNLEAFAALMDTAAHHAIASDRIIHTGDAVAYCADAEATVRALRTFGAHAIRGNVEESLCASAPDCGCGFQEGSECEKLSAAWFAHADAEVGADARRWMAALPLQLAFTIAGKRVRVVHGGSASINRFIFASMPESLFAEEFAAARADIIIAGHSGLPFTRRFGDRVWHNSGALGMPANDGTPRVWYSLIIPERAGRLRFEHRALRYDHEAARQKMLAAGLPGGYADALATGLWPSLDVLPPAEKGCAGRPIDQAALNASAGEAAFATG